MDKLNLAGKSFNFTSIGLEISFTNSENHLCIKIKEFVDDDAFTEDEYVILDVTSASKKIKSEDPIEINDDQLILLGYLILGNTKNKDIIHSSSFITSTVLYFLLIDQLEIESDIENITAPLDFESNTYIEERNVLFVNKGRFQIYNENYKTGSEIWGGFSHRKLPSAVQEEISTITAVSGINFPTVEHEIKAFYSTSSDNSFTRFLNKYQMVELLFDYLTVARLRVSKNNLSGFRDIMNAYDHDEILLLKSILRDYVNDTSKLSSLMYEFSDFSNITIDLFQKHSKASNPLKDDISWEKFWKNLNDQKLSLSDVTSCKERKFLKSIQKDNDKSLSLALTNITAYWIYRVRCSIAHNKIGEFIFSDEDEKFIIDAAEPLLDEVLSQLLTNSDLNELLEKSKIVGELMHD